MSTELLILGAGGTGREVLAWMDELNAATERYHCIGFLDDNPALRDSEVGGVRVVGTLADVGRWPRARLVDALGGPRSFGRRRDMIVRSGAQEGQFESIVHPRAYISTRSTVGSGCVIFPHVTICAHVTLGHHVVVLSGAVINHDSRIGDFSIVTSGANISGGVTIGSGCYIGTGSAVIQGASIGAGALVGMGAVVRGDVAPGAVVAGNPGRVLREALDEG